MECYMKQNVRKHTILYPNETTILETNYEKNVEK